jgi:hypothetical protein
LAAAEHDAPEDDAETAESAKKLVTLEEARIDARSPFRRIWKRCSCFKRASGARGHLKYAFCATGCTTASNWQITVLDSGTFLFSSPRALAVDGTGRLHLVYQKSDSLGVAPLYYARCDTGCASAASWRRSRNGSTRRRTPRRPSART